jgi:hypothetical protein
MIGATRLSRPVLMQLSDAVLPGVAGVESCVNHIV